MEFEFFQKAMKGSLLLAFVVSLILVLVLGLSKEAIAVLLGALWSYVNVILIKMLLSNLIVVGQRRDILKILTGLLSKFPCLYLAGYSMITYFELPAIYCLIGFSMFFVVLLMNSIKMSFSPSKACLLLLMVALPVSLQANLTTDVPEVPNIFSLLFTGDDLPHWQEFIHDWENIIFAFLAAIFISIIFCVGAKRKTSIPSGLQNFLEYLVEILQKASQELIGRQGQKFVPFLGTLFIYIAVMNWMVLIPFLKSPSSSLNVTVALAICVFCLVQYLSIKSFGLKGYLYHMAGSPQGAVEWAMVPVMLPIEMLTQLTRPLTLAFRLFGNVIGEDILIGAFALFGATLFAGSQLPLALPLQLPFMLFALFTGFIQALVFTLMSAIYILLSMPEWEEVAPD